MTDIEKKNVRENFRRLLALDLIFSDQEQQDWILDYLTSGKGIIPYQTITSLDSLEMTPKDGDFFDKEDFYSSLEEKNISDQEYSDVKNFFKLMRMKTLGEMNKIYNIQDTLILCEIFEQRSVLLQKLFKFNPRKCNSTSSFSGCVQRSKSKCNIVLPTDAKQIRVFEENLIGGYSCVNTRAAFDTEIFLRDKDNEKVLFKTAEGEVKRFSSKIIKIDENNQYGFAMTKPLLSGCIKLKKSVPTVAELKDILTNITLDDKIGHLFIVDIFFKDINEKAILFNELYPLIFQKNIKIEPFERSCSQIMSRATVKKNKNKEDTIYSLPHNSKTHSTLKEKIYFPLYAEDLYFLTTRTGWEVTKIYEHYTFKQDRLKKDFVVMNLNAGKTANSKVEKDFYKLLNNSNFGNNFRNNVGNCSLELIYEGPEELKYIKKFTNVFSDIKFNEFFSEDVLRKQAEDEIEEKLKKLDPDDEFYVAMKDDIIELRDEKLEAIDGFIKKRKRCFKNSSYQKKIDSIEKQLEDSMDLRKNKMMIEFNDLECSAIKHIAVKSKTNIKCTTRFMSGKLLMFAKLSLKSFICSLAELFMFPEENEVVQKVYDKYLIEKILVYHILTDTDSTSIQFIAISKLESTFTENEFRNILFETISKNEIRNTRSI